MSPEQYAKKKETAAVQIVYRQWKKEYQSAKRKTLAFCSISYMHIVCEMWRKNLWENKSLSANNYYNKVAMYANTM